MHTFPMSQHSSMFTHCSLNSLHGVIEKHGYVNILILKYLQPLPYSFHASGRISLAEWHRNTIMRIERTQLYKPVSCLTCHIHYQSIWIFLQHILQLFSF